MRRGRSAGVFLAILLSAGAPGAQARTMAERMKAACGTDVARFCAGLDEERTKVCMLDHRREVDPACMRLVDAAE